MTEMREEQVAQTEVKKRAEEERLRNLASMFTIEEIKREEASRRERQQAKVKILLNEFFGVFFNFFFCTSKGLIFLFRLLKRTRTEFPKGRRIKSTDFNYSTANPRTIVQRSSARTTGKKFTYRKRTLSKSVKWRAAWTAEFLFARETQVSIIFLKI